MHSHALACSAPAKLGACCHPLHPLPPSAPAPALSFRPPSAAQDYLPPAVQPTFLAAVTEFLWLPWKEAMQSAVEGATQGGSQVRRWPGQGQR